MTLDSYRKKRNFAKTPEPEGRLHQTSKHLYIIQKHAARRLHYDFRLELNGVLKSWAIPKGPCLDPSIKRLAVEVEDHPVEYGHFEGIIPKGEYGGGTVMLWDEGEWLSMDANPMAAYEKGHLHLQLHAKKLKGQWDLIRFKEKQWFLVKYRDQEAKSLQEYDITVEQPLSVLSHLSMEEIATQYQAVWHSNAKTKSHPHQESLAKQFHLDLPKTPFPKPCAVQLATLEEKPPRGKQWLHELKFDGYRILAYKQENKINLLSRNQLNWTAKFPNVVEALQQLAISNVILDGEIVILDERSHSNFQLLQNAMNGSNKDQDFIYYVFDLLYLEQTDLRSLPLLERKKFLATLLSESNPTLRYSDHIIGEGETVFANACQFDLEGIISKKSDSPYEGKRTKSWLKIKCHQREEFVIGGYLKSEKEQRLFRSLLLGFFNAKGEFIYSGRVGTGFTEASLQYLNNKMNTLISNTSPFKTIPSDAKKAVWIKPELVAEIEFSQRTDDGRLRHPSFKGLRPDKNAQEIIQK